LLEERRIVDDPLPQHLQSTSTEKQVAERENEQYKEINRLKLKAYVDADTQFKLQMNKVCGLMFSQCSQTLQHKIETSADFGTKIKNDPIALMRIIERYSVSVVSTRHPYDLGVDSWINLVQTKQRDDETILEYMQRFLSANDMYIALAGGPYCAETLVFDHPDFDKADMGKVEYCRADVAERLLTMLYIKNADVNRFGSSQQTLKNDQYPRTVLAAQETLEDRKWDISNYDQQPKYSQEVSKSARDDVANQITTVDEIPELTFQQLELHCWCCGQTGHGIISCHSKEKIPKGQWTSNKVKAGQQMQPMSDENRSRSVAQSTVPSTTQMYDFTCMHQVCLQQTCVPELDKWLLIDSASSVDLFCNKSYVIDIHACCQTLTVASSGGMFSTNLKATVPGYGLVWFSEKAISNIFSLAGMMDIFQVVMDSAVAQAITVKTLAKDINFVRLSNNLYVYKPSVRAMTAPHEVGSSYIPQPKETSQIRLCNSIVDTRKYYSEWQLKRADAARNLMHTLAYPTVKDIKTVLKMNAIKNCPITEQDVDLAVKIYGQYET
jgi:hypothetical protein